MVLRLDFMIFHSEHLDFVLFLLTCATLLAGAVKYANCISAEGQGPLPQWGYLLSVGGNS